MKRTFLIGAAIAAASLTALWAFAGPPAADPGNPFALGVASRGEDYLVKYSQRGDSRILLVTGFGSPSSPFPHTNAQGLMATRIRITDLNNSGARYGLCEGGDTFFTVLVAEIEAGGSTVEYSLDPPLHIGDGLSSWFLSSDLALSVEFYGTALPPPRIGGESIVVE